MPRQRGWPYGGAAASPPALTQSPDGLLSSERQLAGPLRRGTTRVGPVGPRGVPNGGFAASDFGLDRTSPRCHDPIGRAPYTAESELISRKYRP